MFIFLLLTLTNPHPRHTTVAPTFFSPLIILITRQDLHSFNTVILFCLQSIFLSPRFLICMFSPTRNYFLIAFNMPPCIPSASFSSSSSSSVSFLFLRTLLPVIVFLPVLPILKLQGDLFHSFHLRTTLSSFSLISLKVKNYITDLQGRLSFLPFLILGKWSSLKETIVVTTGEDAGVVSFSPFIQNLPGSPSSHPCSHFLFFLFLKNYSVCCMFPVCYYYYFFSVSPSFYIYIFGGFLVVVSLSQSWRYLGGLFLLLLLAARRNGGELSNVALLHFKASYIPLFRSSDR